jgi:hypothetical protein
MFLFCCGVVFGFVWFCLVLFGFVWLLCVSWTVYLFLGVILYLQYLLGLFVTTP